MNDSTAVPVAKPCYVHEHLSPALHGFLDVCRALSKGSGRKHLYFSGEAMASHFYPMGVTTAYTYANELVDKGWLKVVKPSYTLPTGRKSPTIYLVLEHGEWAAEHPGACAELAFVKGAKRAAKRARKATEEPLPITNEPLPIREGATSPLPISTPPLPILSEPLPISTPPLPIEVDNSYLLTHKNKPIPPTDAPSASPDSVVADSFFLRNLPKAERKRGSATKLDSAKTAPDSGAGVSDALRAELRQRADQLLEPFTNSLGIHIGLERSRWVDGVTSLLLAGHSEDAIREAIKHTIGKSSDERRQSFNYGFPEWLKQMEREVSLDTGAMTEAA